MECESGECRCLSDIKRDGLPYSVGAAEENARDSMVVLVLALLYEKFLVR